MVKDHEMFPVIRAAAVLSKRQYSLSSTLCLSQYHLVSQLAGEYYLLKKMFFSIEYLFLIFMGRSNERETSKPY